MAKTLAEKIAVMCAAELGEKIESRPRRGDPTAWSPNPNPIWDWWNWDYRVAPKEPRKFHVYMKSNGVVGITNPGHITEIAPLYIAHGWTEFVNLIEVLPETK